MQIKLADPEIPEIKALVEQHMKEMLANSPEGACQFFNITELKAPEVTFWAVLEEDDSALMGCGAITEYEDEAGRPWGEIKSMRAHADHLRKGVGAAMLNHIIAEAQKRSYSQLKLQTGTGEYFDAAHALYLRHGFEYCEPFRDYVADGFASYMTKQL